MRLSGRDATFDNVGEVFRALQINDRRNPNVEMPSINASLQFYAFQLRQRLIAHPLAIVIDCS